MTILFDSGVRTGPDVFKAIALGAHAVMVGRLYVWGMSHEGETGCRHVIKSLLAVSRPYIMQANFHSEWLIEQDLDITMTVAGYRSIREDVYRNKEALRYNPHGIPPAHEDHAKL